MAQFLYEDVYNQILSEIRLGHYRSGEEIPKEKELCEFYGVSLVTVRRALAELEKAGIVRKFQGKGTIVSDRIRGISGGSSLNRNLGVLSMQIEEQALHAYPSVSDRCPDINRNDWKNIIYSAMSKKIGQDFNLIISDLSKENLLHRFDETVFARLDRILLIGPSDPEVIHFLHRQKKLVIMYNNFNPDVTVCNVRSDDRAACCQAVEDLIREGRRHIAAINGPLTYNESVERAMGYQQALINQNQVIDSSLIKWGDMTAESGYYYMNLLLDQSVRPDAVFCVNDSVAAGVCLSLREHGIACPDTICVIGHDNNPWAGKSQGVRISSIDPCFHQIGEKIAEQMTRPVWIDDQCTIPCRFVRHDTSL